MDFWCQDSKDEVDCSFEIALGFDKDGAWKRQTPYMLALEGSSLAIHKQPQSQGSTSHGLTSNLQSWQGVSSSMLFGYGRSNGLTEGFEHSFCMDLTDDLLHLVFSSLDQRSLCCAAMVCHQWSSLSRHELFWRALTFEGETVTQEKVGWLCHRYPNAVEINLLEVPCMDEVAREAMYSLRGLERLNLCKGTLTECFFSALSTCCWALQELNITDAVLGSGSCQEILVCHENLQRLRATKCRVMRIHVRCPLLSELSLKRTSAVAAVLHCPRLLSLDISSCNKLSDASICAAVMACPSLVSLDISQCSYVSDETLRAISLVCCNLHVLNASDCPNISLQDVCLPLLRELRVQNFEGANSVLMRTVSQCNVLESIRLHPFALLTSVVLDIQHMRNRNLATCSRFTDVTLRYLSLAAISRSTCQVSNHAKISGVMLKAGHEILNIGICPVPNSKSESASMVSLAPTGCGTLGLANIQCPQLLSSDALCRSQLEDKYLKAILGRCPSIDYLILASCVPGVPGGRQAGPLALVVCGSMSMLNSSYTFLMSLALILETCSPLKTVRQSACNYLLNNAFKSLNGRKKYPQPWELEHCYGSLGHAAVNKVEACYGRFNLPMLNKIICLCVVLNGCIKFSDLNWENKSWSSKLNILVEEAVLQPIQNFSVGQCVAREVWRHTSRVGRSSFQNAEVTLQTVNIGICAPVTNSIVELSSMVLLDLQRCCVLAQTNVRDPQRLPFDVWNCSQFQDECIEATTGTCLLIQSLMLAWCSSGEPASLLALKIIGSLFDLPYEILPDLMRLFETCSPMQTFRLFPWEYTVSVVLGSLDGIKYCSQLWELDIYYGSFLQREADKTLSQCFFSTYVNLKECMDLYDMDRDNKPWSLNSNMLVGKNILPTTKIIAMGWMSQDVWRLTSKKVGESSTCPSGVRVVFAGRPYVLLRTHNYIGSSTITTQLIEPETINWWTEGGKKTLKFAVEQVNLSSKVQPSSMVLLDLKGCSALAQIHIYYPQPPPIDVFYCSQLQDCLEAMVGSCLLIQSLIMASRSRVRKAGFLGFRSIGPLPLLHLSYAFFMDLIQTFRPLACKDMNCGLDSLYLKKNYSQLWEVDMLYGSIGQRVLVGVLCQGFSASHVNLIGCMEIYDMNWDNKPWSSKFNTVLEEDIVQPIEKFDVGLMLGDVRRNTIGKVLESSSCFSEVQVCRDVFGDHPCILLRTPNNTACSIMITQLTRLKRINWRMEGITSFDYAFRHRSSVDYSNLGGAAWLTDVSSLSVFLSRNIIHVRPECSFDMFVSTRRYNGHMAAKHKTRNKADP